MFAPMTIQLNNMTNMTTFSNAPFECIVKPSPLERICNFHVF